MATRPKAVIESRNGEKLSPITIAKNVLTDNGQNLHDILSDRKEDMMTPTIENSSSMFKVGQGDNVDYSSNVVNGAYESMVLKGKTMVNCIQEPSSKDVILPYEFKDGQYVTINDTKESGTLGVELKGQTLVNIHKLNTPSLLAAEQGWYENLTRASGEISFDVLSTPAGWRYIDAGYLNYQMLKPNTKYLIVFESSQNISSIHFLRGDGLNGLAPSAVRVQNNKAIITTNSQIVANEQILYVNFHANPNTKVSFKNPMIIEYVEGMENWDISYFTGMTSCKTPILHTVGKNLFNINNPSYTWKSDGNLTSTIQENKIKLLGYFSNFKEPYRYEFALKENTSYVFSYETFGNLGYEYPEDFCLRIYKDDTLSRTLWRMRGKVGFTLSNGENKVRFDIRLNKEWGEGEIYEIDGGVQNIQLEESSVKTSYEPHKSSILSLPEEVVLRSLPNGVCDTFNTRTGVYTQRIGEAVVNGSENWQLNNTEGTTTQRFFCSMLVNSAVDNNTKGTQQYLCDRLRTITWNQTCELGITVNGPGVFVYNNSIEYTVGSVKQWLSQNPVKLQYELATPVITKINLPSTLKSWNTTTHIYSEIPENTLYPILTHSNPTYPVILKPSTKYSIVVDSYSNNHTNSAIKFNLGGATASTTVSNRVTTITTPSTLSNELLTMSGRGNKLNNVMVIDGDVIGDEPYFEGICDCKSPILSNVGKNLFDINNHTESQWSFSSGYPYEQNTSYGDRLKILGDEIHFSTDGGTVNKGVGYYIPLCKNKDYTFRINKKDGNGNYCVKLVLIHSSEYPLKQAIQQHSKFGINNETITSSLEANFNSANYDMCAIYIGGGWESGTQTTRSYVFNNISLTESNQQVEPYKSNTTTFDQKDGKTIVLRSLPNGVCDTLNVETGEYVQRIGELVADGSNIGYKVNGIGVGEMDTFRFQLSDPSIKNVPEVKGNLICDQLPWRVIWSASVERTIGCYAANSENRIIVRMLKEKFDTLNVDGINRYLTNNPITFQYELATPIVTTIDVQGFPHAYTNGHVQLSSGSIEQSLTPKVKYSVVTNRNGQIRSNQKMVERHQKQLDRLQAMILTNLVNTQYEQALTNLKYDLKNVREEVK